MKKVLGLVVILFTTICNGFRTGYLGERRIDSGNLPSIFAAIQSMFPNVASSDRDTYSAGRLDYNGPWDTHMFARVNYEANSFDTGNQYSTYANRDNAPGIAGGADFARGRFTHSFRGSYEKFHNLIVDTTLGNNSIYNPIAGLGISYDAAPFTSGPNPNAPQQTFQTDKQLRYDGSWTKGAHNIRYGASLNRILGGGLAAFFGYGPQVTLDPGTVLANCPGVAAGAACNTDPVNGYPIRWRRLPEGMSLEPSVSIYNVFNFANYNALTVGGGGGGTILTPGDLASSGGGGNVNGPSDYAAYNAQRVSRRTGTFDQGAPRATEFQLKMNF